MSEQRQKRVSIGAEIRMPEGGDGREFIARAIRYNVVDDYASIWSPGVFTDHLSRRMPVIAWAHQWTEPIGRYQKVLRDDDEALELLGRLDDFDDVPRARQAASQFRSGTLTDFSVGFTRREWIDLSGLSDSDRALGAVERITVADLDEVSPVLVGAVPGTALLAVRAGGMVDVDQVVELARRVKAGELTQDEAVTAVALLAGEPDSGQVPVVEDDGAQVALEAEAEQLLAEADDALTRVGPGGGFRRPMPDAWA